MRLKTCTRGHRSRTGVVTGGILAALAALVITSCAMPPTPQEGVTDVAMRNIAFDPNVVTIKVGESVRWTNFDLVPHTATSGNPGDADAGSLFDSGTLPINQSFTHPFNEAGEFVYFCRTHPTMMFNARVIVTE